MIAGEWTDEEAAKRSIPIVGDCVAEYIKHGGGGKFIFFGANVAHCEEARKQFLAAGVKVELYTYMTPEDDRREMLKELRKPDSTIRGLLSVAALSKGFDLADIEVIIIARPLKSSRVGKFTKRFRRLLSPGPAVCAARPNKKV